MSAKTKSELDKLIFKCRRLAKELHVRNRVRDKSQRRKPADKTAEDIVNMLVAKKFSVRRDVTVGLDSGEDDLPEHICIIQADWSFSNKRNQSSMGEAYTMAEAVLNAVAYRTKSWLWFVRQEIGKYFEGYKN